MFVTPRHIVALGVMLALVLAVAASLAARTASTGGPVGVSAPLSLRAPVAPLSPRKFEDRWSGAVEIAGL